MPLSCIINLFPKFKEVTSRDSKHNFWRMVYRARTIVLPCVNQHTKYELPSKTNFKDMIGENLKGSCKHDTPIMGVICHLKAST